jgi:hypothetical protein
MSVETSKPSSDAGLQGSRESVRTPARLVLASGAALLRALAARSGGLGRAVRAVSCSARGVLPKFDSYTVSDGGSCFEIFADREGIFLFIHPTQYALVWPWAQV